MDPAGDPPLMGPALPARPAPKPKWVPLTPPDQLTALLELLHPVTTGFELVRLGPPGDGGYLVPDDLDGIAACFSPGVGTLSGFEAACAERGMWVFMADGSVDGPGDDAVGAGAGAGAGGARSVFTRRHLDVVASEVTMTIDSWIGDGLAALDAAGVAADADLLLQMDIEGAEWAVLPTLASELLGRFRIIVLELHQFFDLHRAPVFRHMGPVLRRLVHTHQVVHLHPNNCCPEMTVGEITLPKVIEMTLLRRDRAVATGYVSERRHRLDRDNTARPSLELPAALLRSVG